uniref:Uncharacterized protein n=1 Tax=Siphoviridae sp. ctHSY3 TaxID=2825421 RepID=A0A8S5TUZ9_9CAUD|nr:MAG TPA: hypothetical protein [Siphoviridae sp. ctHSY3]
MLCQCRHDLNSHAPSLCHSGITCNHMAIF